MDYIINESLVYPEIKSMALFNQMTGQETIVTEARLQSIFPDPDVRAQVLAGRHKSWLVYDIPNAFGNMV